MPDPAPALADYDQLQLHRLLLGRDPGSEGELAARRGRTLDSVLREFAGSEEFRLQLQAPIRAGRLPTPPAHRFPASPVAGWAATALPMADDARAGLAAARTWPGLFAALFGDAVFRREIEGVNPKAGSEAFAHACRAMSEALGGRALQGGVDAFGREETRGWALETDTPDRPVELELRADGRVAARTRTALFRRELQETLGGAGRFGFAFDAEADGLAPWPAGTRLEVRDALSGVILAATTLDLAPEAGPIARFRDDVVKAREALAWLERRAGELGAAATFPLAEYGAWARAYGIETFRAERERAERARGFAHPVRFSLLVSAADAPLDHAPLLRGLARQEVAEVEVLIVERAERADALRALIAQLDPATRACCRIVEARGEADIDAALGRAATLATGDRVLLLGGGDALAPDALFRLQAALQKEPRPQVLFGDDDRFEDGADGEPLRSAPRLRGAFDPDLLLQTDALGPALLVRRRELDLALAGGGSLALGRRHDLALRLLEVAGDDGFAHVPGVLVSRRRGGPSERAGEHLPRLADVAAHLARSGSLARVEPRIDPLGAPARGALRVVHPVPVRTEAALLIPTRDRLDLLRPCVESLEASRPANRTPFALTLIDNGSEEAETLAWLAAGEAEGRWRVVRSDAPFNFAALNNLGAAAAGGDLIVLLNNDMEVLTPGWLDALAGEAMRPEVGVVGARLVYEDLTLQHAGVVTGGVHELAGHEGVGVPASDGGYLGRHALTRRVSAVTCACLATRREVWERLGGLDAARFAVDGNDVDYGLRVQAEGLAVIYTPDCTLFHHESKSRGFNVKSVQAQARGEAEAERLAGRWGARLRRDPYYNPLFDRAAKPFTRLGPPPPPGFREGDEAL